MAEYFAGVNTEKGFMGFPKEYFGSLSRLYIIKGTAGSGKSTLMKRIADQCEKLGIETDRVYCSSDPNSLDGVILPRNGTAVADGTAPHLLEPITPVAKEILVDTGRFMDEKKLDKEGIIYYSRKKKEYYSRAYSFILCGVEASRVCSDIVFAAMDKAKLYSYGERFFKRHIESKVFSKAVHTRIAAAFTGRGLRVLDPFPQAERVFTLRGGRGNEHIFIKQLYDIALDAGEEACVSPDATDSQRLNGIYFPIRRVYVTSLPTERGTEINMARFFVTAEYAKQKQEIKEISETAKKAYSLAEKQLFSAAACHGELEKRYVSAMDFEPLDQEYRRIIKGMTE